MESARELPSGLVGQPRELIKAIDRLHVRHIFHSKHTYVYNSLIIKSLNNNVGQSYFIFHVYETVYS